MIGPDRRSFAIAVVSALLVTAGALPRVLLAAGVLPEGLRPFVWSDVLFTWERGLSGGRLPYWDTYFEYPPLIGYPSAALSAVAPDALTYVAAWAGLQVAAAAAVGALIARWPGRPWRWALAPQLVLFGSLNFDLLAVLGLVLALHLARGGAQARAAAALAAGTAAKLFPAVVLPVLLLGARPRVAALRLGLFAAVVAALYLPAAGAPYPSLESAVRYPVGIAPNVDSIWGLVAALLRAGGTDPQGPILIVTLAGLAVTYLAVVVPAARRRADPVLTAALAVLTLLLWSRLFSPQYTLWVLPFFALLPLASRTYALLVVADAIVFLTVYPLTLVRWPPGDPAALALLGVLAGAVALRHVALFAALRAAWAAAAVRP